MLPYHRQVFVWHNETSNPTRIIVNSTDILLGLFVSSTGDIYISHRKTSTVQKWVTTTNTLETVARFRGEIIGIFIALNNVLYCSLLNTHQIVTKSLHNNSFLVEVVAGIGISGSESYQLNRPMGIFVTENFDLYVADSQNHRLQLFHSGDTIGTTIVQASDTNPALSEPKSVVLDANNHIYIQDGNIGSIFRSGSSGFQCIVACTGSSGILSDQLKTPHSIALDVYGNIFVVDMGAMRVQKFSILKNTCGKNKLLS